MDIKEENQMCFNALSSIKNEIENIKAELCITSNMNSYIPNIFHCTQEAVLQFFFECFQFFKNRKQVNYGCFLMQSMIVAYRNWNKKSAEVFLQLQIPTQPYQALWCGLPNPTRRSLKECLGTAANVLIQFQKAIKEEDTQLGKEVSILSAVLKSQFDSLLQEIQGIPVYWNDCATPPAIFDKVADPLEDAIKTYYAQDFYQILFK